MALLKLENIGKIYVSEGNVAVGIRGVNLTFDQGEFVAITGESGSGKSTLLNVISGMDTYEEGELFIEGQPTSHYLQPEWEQYRQKYISFIFQDYNIIDSFTVLQNVELALMTIDNAKERRKRAVELIERVGLRSHMKHKGSQLSGGQKQRTVIARALAKDSPIILADEPTGNLDSKTAQEIVELLQEVSRDKLLIVVTHDFDLVENVATRHIRIFDGAVESDRLAGGSEVTEKPSTDDAAEAASAGNEDPREAADPDSTSLVTAPSGVSSECVQNDGFRQMPEQKTAFLSNGIHLGKVLFTSRPKLSFFLCFLLAFGMAGLFFVTALCGGFTDMFRSFYLLQQTEGRLVIVRQDAKPIADDELEGLKNRYGAKDSLHYDYLLDVFCEAGPLYTATGELDPKFEGKVKYVYDTDFGAPDYGRYPQRDGEVFLKLPMYFHNAESPTGLNDDRIVLNECEFSIVGVKFDVDTNEPPTYVFTKEGFLTATAAMGMKLYLSECLVNGEGYPMNKCAVMVSNEVDPDKIYCTNPKFNQSLKNGDSVQLTIQAEGDIYSYIKRDNSYHPNAGKTYKTEQTFRNQEVLTEADIKITGSYRLFAGKDNYYVFLIGANVAKSMFNQSFDGVYAQASLFFRDDSEAKKAVDSLRQEGYTAITTDETYPPTADTLVDLITYGILLGAVWLTAVMMLIFVINLCTNRAVEAFRGDMAIMRSMGIPVRVIKTGMYVRMGLAMTPALALIPLIAYLVYHNVTLSMILVYLRPAHYIFLVLGMLYLTWQTTKRQVRNLFSDSVKKSLRGGDAS